MASTVYRPFEHIEFDDHTCFLTGVKTDEKMSVFPEWLMDRYGFREEEMMMMDKVKKYLFGDLVLPCSPEVKRAFEDLDLEFQKAFDGGYESVRNFDPLKLFQWIGRIVYGLLIYELRFEKARFEKYDKEFDLAQVLKERYGIFHLMLQSIMRPIHFEGVTPWTLLVVRHRLSEDSFSFRDDAINLMFSMRVKGFGIIACLQDNQAIYTKEKELLDKIGEAELHPLQFEELYGRFHYSDYIKLYKPQYLFSEEENEIHIKALPVEAEEGYPLFGLWDEDMFAQLLGNYWELYGLQKHHILRFPDPIKTFLLNPYTGDFIDPDSIEQPY